MSDSLACEFCDKTFKTRSGIRKHWIKIHRKRQEDGEFVDLTDNEFAQEMEKLKTAENAWKKHKSSHSSHSDSKRPCTDGPNKSSTADAKNVVSAPVRDKASNSGSRGRSAFGFMSISCSDNKRRSDSLVRSTSEHRRVSDRYLCDGSVQSQSESILASSAPDFAEAGNPPLSNPLDLSFERHQTKDQEPLFSDVSGFSSEQDDLPMDNVTVSHLPDVAGSHPYPAADGDIAPLNTPPVLMLPCRQDFVPSSSIARSLEQFLVVSTACSLSSYVDVTPSQGIGLMSLPGITSFTSPAHSTILGPVRDLIVSAASVPNILSCSPPILVRGVSVPADADTPSVTMNTDVVKTTITISSDSLVQSVSGSTIMTADTVRPVIVSTSSIASSLPLPAALSSAIVPVGTCAVTTVLGVTSPTAVESARSATTWPRYIPQEGLLDYVFGLPDEDVDVTTARLGQEFELNSEQTSMVRYAVQLTQHAYQHFARRIFVRLNRARVQSGDSATVPPEAIRDLERYLLLHMDRPIPYPLTDPMSRP